MIMRSCLGCGIPILHAGRCARCVPSGPQRNPGGHWSLNRSRTTQARFRRQVLARWGKQCGAIVEGERCPVTTDLQAHHLQAGNNDPATGVPLCRVHHRLVDSYAR